MTERVFDASAVLAVLADEPGADQARSRLGEAVISAVNVIEVLSKLGDLGIDQEAALAAFEDLALAVIPLDTDLAVRAAALRGPTRAAGLSLGDRACLALALSRGSPAVTTDRAWAGLALDLEVELIR